MAEQSYLVPRQMQALLKKAEVTSYVLDTVEVNEPIGDEVLIKVDAVSICGSDIALYQWNDVAKSIAKIPFIPGHEAAGTVVKCGPQATLKVGDRIGVENHFFCDDCYQCHQGTKGICISMGQYGHGKGTMHGGCSQYSIVSSKYCYKITKNLSAAEVALLEPLGVSHNAIEALEVRNEMVLIIGCGPIGLLATSLAKNMGATKVIVADINEKRLELAQSMGADIAINTTLQNLHDEIFKITNNVGIGRIAEMSGSDVVNSMFSMLRKGGHIVMVGLPKKPLHVENVLQDIVFKSLTLKSVHGRKIYHTWTEIEQLVANKKIDLNKVISHQLPMDQYEEAFQALFSGHACKIILYPNGMP